MPTTFTVQDIELLGYTNPSEITTDTTAPWKHFRAIAIAGLESIETRFLYLKASCTVDDIRRAARDLPRGAHAYVIKPNSFKVTENKLKEIFGPQIPIHEHDALIWKKLHDLFREYLESLSDVPMEKYYVPPRSTDPEIGDQLMDAILRYLRRTSANDNGILLALRAHAGVGKTTLSRFALRRLASESAKSKTIPVYVEASHWGKLHLESVEALWEIIDNSLRTFSSNLVFREELFNHALRQGYISFIFDGFDELCGHKGSQFAPTAVLKRLSDIAHESEARILLTTRTLYWEAEISDVPNNVRRLDLDAFNTQQAKGYFAQYFKDDFGARSRAFEMYKKLVEGSFRPRQDGGVRAQFVNLPLCVAMLARYAKDGATDVRAESGKQLLENILLAICGREVERKTLKTRPRAQLASFQEVAIYDEERENPTFDLELLEAAGFASEDVRKLVDHPLLQRTQDNRYCFSYDFLGPYLRALSVADCIVERRKDFGASLIAFMAREANGKGYILEQLGALLEYEDLTAVGRMARAVRKVNGEVGSFLFHVAKLLIDQDTEAVTATDRATLLFGALEGLGFERNRSVTNWLFSGSMERIDFRNTQFIECAFRDVSFRNCNADSSTIFTRCNFSGALEFPPGKGSGWSEVTIKDCQLSFPANAVWEEVLGREVGSRDERITDALRLALGRFWYHGRPRMSLRIDDWGKGILGHSGMAKPVLEAMLKAGLVQRIHISGVVEGGIAFDRDSLGDLQQYMDNQHLGGKIKEVYELLINS